MHVVVTGSSRGIGREMVARLRDAGHEVTGTSRDHSSGVRLDVTDPGQQARHQGCISVAAPRPAI